MNWKTIIFALMIGGVLFFGGSFVIQKIKNGSRVGMKSHRDDSDTYVLEWPDALIKSSGYDAETYSLARALASEHFNEPDIVLRAVAWAIKNEAKRRKKTIFQLTTQGNYSGRYARQRAGKDPETGIGRYVATQTDPFERHIRIAKDPGIDITNGATNFFSPSAQDTLNKQNPQKWTTADVKREQWIAGGLEPVAVFGIDSDVITFFRPV